MKQLTQKLKNGQMEVLEVPTPILSPGMILVRNRYSLISAGTEGSTVTAARKSLVGKAKDRPQQVKQVIDVVLQQGMTQAYRAVMKKLDSYSPLGYSSAGEVINVAPDVKGLRVGDLVACGGTGYANHAEVVAVPINLCVTLRQDADLKKAAYNALGAIALQGIRQADVSIGETCVVIGLGLIGQITCLILRAGGVRVIGVDVNPSVVAKASNHCADFAFTRDHVGLAEKIDEISEGMGVDAVIIAASTDSTDPINFSGRILRKKGKVIVVGSVPTGFERDPFFYKKELELRMSCSYGPGRYDLSYEEKGIDYPFGHVRWTEKRNMQAFQDLLFSGKINIDYLTSHTFSLDQAPAAYNMIIEKSEPFLGIIIEYDTSSQLTESKVSFSKSLNPIKDGVIGIAFIGAGSYAMSHLLPNIPKDKSILLKGVMTSSGTTSRTVAEKYGFEFCTSNEMEILGESDINTVFIATRHNTHAEYVMKSLQAGKNVFVEKPLCLREEQLHEIRNTYSSLSSSKSSPGLMVGFNRRFSPFVDMIKGHLGEGPMSMLYRINAGPIPADSWIQDKDIGGGRVIGEVCHFVDILTFINGSFPDHVFATTLSDPWKNEDTLTINISFKNGSIGTICYFSNGSKSLFKEYIEVYRTGTTALLKDFKKMEIYKDKKTIKKTFFSQDKGQKRMVSAFIDSIKTGRPLPISFEEIYSATLSTFKILESLRERRAISL